MTESLGGGPLAKGPIRRSPHAGTWYPGGAEELRAMVCSQLEGVSATEIQGQLVALVSPHAGLRYSGPIAASGYRLVREAEPETAVLLGPSHYVSFEGTSIYPRGGFETPLGRVSVDSELAQRLMSVGESIRDFPGAHQREHCLEMQLPFLQEVAPRCRILPLVMGEQTRSNVEKTALAIATVVSEASHPVLLIASSDLSHYQTRSRAAEMDRQVCDRIARFEPEALQALIEIEPRHACGGGPVVAIMHAARKLGATDARLLRYGDSGDVTHDLSGVVGYVAAAFTSARRRA